jgi:hypothetical protein
LKISSTEEDSVSSKRADESVATWGIGEGDPWERRRLFGRGGVKATLRDIVERWGRECLPKAVKIRGKGKKHLEGTEEEEERVSLFPLWL